jgi:hypothetical protein
VPAAIGALPFRRRSRASGREAGVTPPTATEHLRRVPRAHETATCCSANTLKNWGIARRDYFPFGKYLRWWKKQ